MKKSIGRKIFTILAVVSVIFILANLSNLMALSQIQRNNNTVVDIYIKMEDAGGELATSFEKLQLYANLSYYKRDLGKGDILNGKLSDAIEELQTNIGIMEELGKQTKDDKIVSEFATWKNAMSEFAEASKQIHSAIDNKEYDVAETIINSLEDYKIPAQEAKEVFEKTVDEKIDYITLHSAIKIQGTYVFDIILSVAFIVIIVVVMLIVRKTISAPAKKSGMILQEIVTSIDNNEGDLTERIPVRTMDEVGQMSEGINSFLEQLQNVMRKLKDESGRLLASVDSVLQEVNVSTGNAETVSAAMEEMSASTEEISATLSQIADGSTNILNQVNDMNIKVQNGADIVKDIKVHAGSMYKDTIESKESTSQMIINIRKALEEAMQESRNVEKINDLTGDILSITSQTNLLSLNASIEAARAGDAGRGFAVVADEIRVLADSSAETANNIQNISNLVIGAVEKLSKNSEAILKFIDEKVLKDYDGFVQVVGQYEKDADNINDILSEVAKNANDINETMEVMNVGLNDISTAVDDNAKGITNVAESAVSLVEAISQIREETDVNKEVSMQLSSEVNRFKNV